MEMKCTCLTNIQIRYNNNPISFFFFLTFGKSVIYNNFSVFDQVINPGLGDSVISDHLGSTVKIHFIVLNCVPDIWVTSEHNMNTASAKVNIQSFMKAV